MKSIKVEIEIHEKEIMFFLGTKKEISVELEIAVKNSSKGGYLHKIGTVFVCTDDKEGKQRDKAHILGTLVHEITHVVDRMAMKKGFMDELEHKAYISAFLFREAYKGLGF